MTWSRWHRRPACCRCELDARYRIVRRNEADRSPDEPAASNGAAPATTFAAIDKLIELYPAERRAQTQTSLATALRGVVSQVLVRRQRGGRMAAREVLLNTPAVAALIQDGKTAQLPLAIESGRRHGMMPLNDSLAALVRDGTVHVSEAYRKALEKESLLAALKREGIDTSFAERLA